MAGLDTIFRVCIKISGLLLMLLELVKSFAMTMGTPGYGGFDRYMFIQQSLVFLLGIYLLAGGELLFKIGTKHPANFGNSVDFNTIFALGTKIIGLLIILYYSIALLDYIRFSLSIKMMGQGDIPVVIPGLLTGQIPLTILMNIILIVFGCYLFYNGRLIRRIASYKLNGNGDKDDITS